VVGAPEPPQADVAAAAVLAVSPPMAKPAASAIPASFLDRTNEPTLPGATLNDPPDGK
jgi:hypothetical protein